MTKCINSLILFPILLHTLCFLLFPQYLLSQENIFVRQPASQLVITPHQRSNSDPQQVHISLVGKDKMRVSWVTEDKETKSVVEYGTKSGEYSEKTSGENTSYKYFFYNSGKIHNTVIGPLEPNTTYFYKCGGLGPEFSFKTPPSKFPIEFVIVGDLGQTEWTASTLKHVDKSDYDVFLLPGDLSYADSQQPLWDSFGRLVEPYASKRPWMVTQGNHEIEIFPIIYPKGFEAYNTRWPMPFQESGSNSNLYYSFDVIGAHIIMLGSYADFNVESQQYEWLQLDLAKIDRVKTPWVITLVHAPWYTTNEAHQGEGESMREAMEILLYEAHVDLVFAGHVHAYERFTRIYDNKADSCGPMYVTIGDGGNREGLALRLEMPVVEVRKHGVWLLAKTVDQYIHRILVEEDAKDSQERNEELFHASADAGEKLYRKGDFAESGISNLDGYLLKKVGIFPDILERKVRRHFDEGDQVSALVTGEFYTKKEHFPGFARPFVFNAEIMLRVGRKVEAKDAARGALKSPWWTLGCMYRDVANIAQWDDEQIEYIKEKVTEEGRQEDVKKGKAPEQVVLDEAAFLLDLASIEGNWDDYLEQIAKCYEEAGLNDIAKFILYQ